MIAQKVAQLWGKYCFKLSWSRLKIINAHLIDKTKNYLVLANHSSNFDIFLLTGFLGLKVIFISKRTNFNIPLVGWSMKSMGCIPVNRRNKRSALESIEKAADEYQAGMSVIIFPEGTRNLDRKLMPFKEGFMHIAKNNPVTVLPVAIHGAANIQRPRATTVLPGKIVLTINEPITLTPEMQTTPENKKAFVTKIEKVIRASLIESSPEDEKSSW